MSVQTEIDRISAAVQNAHLKVIEKGGTTAAPYLVGNLASAIDTIPEATGGGGSNNYETAQVSIRGCRNVFYTGVENGELVAKSSEGTSKTSAHTIQACCNMPIVCGYLNQTSPIKTTGIEVLGNYSAYIYAITVPDNRTAWAITFGNSG